MKKRPQLNAPFILDFEFGEQALNIQWFDGKPIFRQGFLMVGGLNSSTVATNLQNIIQTLIDGHWAGFVAAAGWFANAGTQTNGINIDLAGLITVDHQSINLTGEIIFCIVEYTKI
jgi:hypothetical protein